MTGLRFLVIGAGRVAQRRARCLMQLGHHAECADLAVLHSKDWWRKRMSTLSSARRPFNWSGTSDPGAYDAALICTPRHTRVQVALECLHIDVPALFIEAPIAENLDGLDELQDSAHGTVMVGCALRFAFNLPRFHWSLLELASSRPRHIRRTGAQLARGRGLSPDIVYPELDLAYAVNGPVHRLDCVTTRTQVRMSIEHESMAHTDIRVDASAEHGKLCKATVSAWDDGTQVVIPARPCHHRYAPNDRVLVDELCHFLGCLHSGELPCNTISDAAYLLSLTSRIRAGANTRA
jgi:predicted dehydrogenase